MLTDNRQMAGLIQGPRLAVSQGIERVFTTWIGTCIAAARSGAGFGGHFPIEYESVMTRQGPLKLAGRGGLRLLRLFEPDGPSRVRSSRRTLGCLMLERGNRRLKSIQSQTEFRRKDRFHFLSEAGLCGERFLLTEIHRMSLRASTIQHVESRSQPPLRAIHFAALHGMGAC